MQSSRDRAGIVLEELIGDSPGIAAVREQVDRLVGRRGAGQRLPPLLLTGETGTGKGLLARALHGASSRRSASFVDVNCGALPENLLEAELFGVERGAYTGADRSRAGLFQAAHHGTLFLDEIALLPVTLQGKLLKVLEERMVRRVGSTRTEAVDAWILAATNEDLDEAMRTGRFRRDLYHRLAVLTVRLPALRERGSDVLRLAEHFLARTCVDYGLSRKTLADDARRALQAHSWPGNVRELANTMERVALLSEAPVVTRAMLELPTSVPPERLSEATDDETPARSRAVAGIAERDQLLEALDATAWNLSQAAARLQLPRNTLRYRMERHGLREPPPSRRPREPAPSAVVARRRVAFLRVAVVSRTEARGRAAMDVAVEKIQTFGGRVEEDTPTAVVGAFGLEPVEDAPRRAALAAIAARKAVARHERDVFVSAGIHLHDCGVEVGPGGVDLDRESREAAWPVLEALASAALPDAVLVSEAAATSLRRRFDLTTATSGIGGAGGAYRLTGGEGTGFGPAETMTAFVGRGQELALLQSRLALARAGRGHVVAIIGEAGIGKSRLLFELRQRLPAEEVTYLEGRCMSYGTQMPYLPWLDIVRQRCGISETDGRPAVQEKVRTVVTALDAPKDQEPYLLSLLGTEGGAAQLREANPFLTKTRTFAALRHLVIASAQRGSVIVAIEDLHWIDKTSDEVLASLIDGIPGAPVFIVMTYRPGYEPAWLSRAHVTQLALPPLSPEDSGTVLRSALRSEPLTRDVEDRLLSRGEGNPFFLEELAHALREQAEIARRTPVPDSIHAVLATRIDRLAPGERRLLQAAAVIGKDVPLALLEAVAGDDPSVVREHLRRLQAADLVWETRPDPHVHFTFKHALTHEVAYATLTLPHRRDLHAKVARLLIGASQTSAAPRPEAIARHLTAADLAGEAIPYWLEAARGAIRRSAGVEAVSQLTTAIDLLRREPDTPARDRREVELQLALGPALSATRGFGSPEVAAVYERAASLCRELGDSRELASALRGIWLFRFIRGELRTARELAERLLGVASRLQDAGFLVEAHVALGLPLIYQGHLAEGRRHLEESVARYDPDRDADHAFIYGQDPLVGALGFLAWTLVLQGHEAEAVASVERAVRHSDTLGHAFTRGLALYFAALVSELRDDHAATLQGAERLITLARDHHFPFWMASGMVLRGRALAVQGHHAEGLTLMEEGLSILRATGAGVAGMSIIRNIAEGYRVVGAVDRAMAAVTEGLAAAERYDSRSGEPELHRIRAEILAADAATSGEAEAAFRLAVALARHQGSRLFARRAAAAFASYLRQRQRLTEAEHVLAENAPEPPVRP
jgi:DNA-binding NtrC family response regulator/predicted ATPase